MTWLYVAYIKNKYALLCKEDDILPFLFGLSENIVDTQEEMQKYNVMPAVIYDYVAVDKPEATLLGLHSELKSCRIGQSSWFNLSFCEVDRLMRVMNELYEEIV